MSGSCFIYSVFIQLELTKILCTKYNNTKYAGCKKVVFTKKIYQFIILTLKKKNYLKLNEPNAHSKKLRKEQQTNPKERSRKKIIEISAKIKQKVKFHINIQKLKII